MPHRNPGSAPVPVPTPAWSAQLGVPALAFVAFAALLWTAVPALLQSVPHADNVEQLNWAHALQWGYLKHPPLPTWLTHAAVLVAGPGGTITYALAMACVALTLVLLWRSALLVLAPQAALLALLASSADYYLMGRGSFLNHNTVMLPMVAASAWAVLHIVRTPPAAVATPGQPTRWPAWSYWLILGLAQALGMLTKYQMAVIIAANGLALLACGVWRQRRFAVHALLCALVTTLPLLPHVAWLRAHEFSTFAYAGHSLLADLPLIERLTHTLGFLAQQVGRLLPAGLLVALALTAARRGGGPMAPADAAPTSPLVGPAAFDYLRGEFRVRQDHRALAVLAVVPLGIVILLCVVAGVAPQNHWGASTTLLLPLLGVSALLGATRGGTDRRAPRPATALGIAAFVHLAAVAWDTGDAWHSTKFHHAFAARGLAAQALAYWQEHEPQAGMAGPRVVIGPDWDAGAIALALPGYPPVIASGERAQAPWVSDAQIGQCGALVLWRPGQPPADQVGADFAARIQWPRELRATGPAGTESVLMAGIIAPAPGAAPCAGAP